MNEAFVNHEIASALSQKICSSPLRCSSVTRPSFLGPPHEFLTLRFEIKVSLGVGPSRITLTQPISTYSVKIIYLYNIEEGIQGACHPNESHRSRAPWNNWPRRRKGVLCSTILDSLAAKVYFLQISIYRHHSLARAMFFKGSWRSFKSFLPDCAKQRRYVMSLCMSVSSLFCDAVL